MWWTVLLSPIMTIIKRLLPDPEAQAKAQQEIIDTLANIDISQIRVNESEAENPNMFVAGWRPFIGWVCGIAFVWEFVVLPILLFITSAFGYHIPVPVFDTTMMTTVLMGMLGLGGLRTYERVQGVERNTWKRK